MHKVQEFYNNCITGRSCENICSSSGGAQEKRKDRMKLGAQEKRKDIMKLSLPPKLVEKTSLGPSYLVL